MDRALESESEICVWAINLEQVRAVFSVIEAPRHEIGFLHAQDALFLYYPHGARDFFEQECWPNFVDALVTSSIENAGSKPPLRKLTLDRSENKQLARLLWRERYTKARLMPTYDNVAESAKSKWQLDES